MKLMLNEQEIKLLENANVLFSDEKDYSDDDLFELLDMVHDAEVYFAQDSDSSKVARKQAAEYAALADKIQGMIPD